MAQGDQLYVYRELMNLEGVYEHHGIDCGDGTIIHYRKPSEVVECTSLATFTRGNPIYLRQYPDSFCFIADVVVSRAKSRLGEKKYNLLFNNCEHFATWCKTGMSYSKQIESFIPALKKIKVSNLYDPLKNALQDTDSQTAQALLNSALGDLKTVWDDIQPKYKQAIKEQETWQKVAQEAVRRNRDDLARAALQKKLNYQQQANQLKEQLEQLAILTEDVLKKLNSSLV
ncbi:lecithin retinol acyltransferase family protein [Crocosphaera sp. UHCC 0190]|uniref:lecithin retinol acyltransferase family protein n=1 Tax=Crocosphaera sp. UHCC 0190 TaxID=3110246 RepID=UPI002B21BD90|nr:lecithin retinol acyltransferase family protein [Crocosphaera sp. UHCC 0190]MEA5508247.1 lecithin retinol acyltransferase family protein [Crocosphaera sp. UHCC 0190]